MNWTWFTNLFDSYNRVARIYPAILSSAPILVSVAVLYPGIIKDIPQGVGALIIVGCILYFLSSFARSRGKAIEARLLAKWGGWPTTQLLRHRDSSVDPATKARYHAALRTLCPDLKLPTIGEEKQEPAAADDIYRSATKCLIEARRGPQYPLLHHENASYGFRRNLFGLKLIAIVIAAAAAVLTIGRWLTLAAALNWPMLIQSASEHPQLPWLALFDILCITFYALIVHESFVAQAAREYAEALFRTLDGQRIN